MYRKKRSQLLERKKKKITRSVLPVSAQIYFQNYGPSHTQSFLINGQDKTDEKWSFKAGIYAAVGTP